MSERIFLTSEDCSLAASAIKGYLLLGYDEWKVGRPKDHSKKRLNELRVRLNRVSKILRHYDAHLWVNRD